MFREMMALPPAICKRLALVLFGFEGATERPNEAQELAADRGDHLLLAFAASEQPAVARVQPVLRLPSYRRHFGTEGRLALAKRPAVGIGTQPSPGCAGVNC
jgi:hypothetical protein